MSHDELEEVGIPHVLPKPRPPAAFKSWPGAPPQLAAQGYPQAKEFPTFEALNLGQGDVRQAKLTMSQNMTYENVRKLLGPSTWSS